MQHRGSDETAPRGRLARLLGLRVHRILRVSTGFYVRRCFTDVTRFLADQTALLPPTCRRGESP